MDNQHKKISGYRDLTQIEIDTMNQAKELAESVGRLVSAIGQIADDPDLNISIDRRWLSIAQTDLQKGFMSLVRSIARPTTF